MTKSAVVFTMLTSRTPVFLIILNTIVLAKLPCRRTLSHNKLVQGTFIFNNFSAQEILVPVGKAAVLRSRDASRYTHHHRHSTAVRGPLHKSGDRIYLSGISVRDK